MTSYVADDALAGRLDQLTTLAPDADRAARVRARCHTQLLRSRRRAARTAEIAGFASRVLGPVVVGAFCVFYTAVMVALAVELESILP